MGAVDEKGAPVPFGLPRSTVAQRAAPGSAPAARSFDVSVVSRLPRPTSFSPPAWS